jgi:hypothetical protein
MVSAFTFKSKFELQSDTQKVVLLSLINEVHSNPICRCILPFISTFKNQYARARNLIHSVRKLRLNGHREESSNEEENFQT